jgi:hypothetical protein
MDNQAPVSTSETATDAAVVALEKTPGVKAAVDGMTWLGMFIVIALAMFGVWAFPMLMFSETPPHVRFPIATILYNILFASSPGFGEPSDAREFLIVLGGLFGLLVGTSITISMTVSAVLKAVINISNKSES